MPFVSRAGELSALRRLHAGQRHALILGPAGAGKTALVRHAATLIPLLICPDSSRLTDICGSLESQLGLEARDLRLPARKGRVFRALAERRRVVVFDGVSRTTPRLSSFLGAVCERVPVWLCARSDHRRDIGHIWPLLFRFARVEIGPFHPADTRALVDAAVAAGAVPVSSRPAAGQLHHMSGGIPGVLCGLLRELATGRYDPSRPFYLRLADLDRRIHAIPPAAVPPP